MILSRKPCWAITEEGRERRKTVIKAATRGEDLRFTSAGIFTAEVKKARTREKRDMERPYPTRVEKSTSIIFDGLVKVHLPFDGLTVLSKIEGLTLLSKSKWGFSERDAVMNSPRSFGQQPVKALDWVGKT
jgi:hypothetical protein